ncbi:MAG: hypothetical protein ACI4TC_06555 [Kiritimatiellia bacterium]
MLRINPFGQQMLLEQGKKQKTLAATTNTGNYLHKTITFSCDQFLKITFSLDFHGKFYCSNFGRPNRSLNSYIIPHQPKESHVPAYSVSQHRCAVLTDLGI